MIKEKIKNELAKAVLDLQKKGELPEFELPQFEIEIPGDETYGDYFSNLALKISGLAKKPSLQIAEILANEIEKEDFEKVEAVKPGFLNFFLSGKFLSGQLKEILKQGEKFGSLESGHDKKIQVEFISANPTGPLTLGNGRGGFCGDVLVNIFKKAGYEVEKEFFINNIGEQVRKLGHSILKDGQEVYKGKYIDDLAEKIKTENVEEAGDTGAKIILDELIRPTVLEKMKINFDQWQSEKELHQNGLVEKVLELMKKEDLIYEQNNAVWFKSSEFGDDKDRVLFKKDGEKTYFLSDIAYHYDKFVNRKYDLVIDIWGADHHGYINRLMAVKKALKMPGELKIIIMQLVKLFSGGQEVKMSKRLGTYITINELIDEVGLDAARFFFLMYSSDTHMDFNMDLAKEQNQKNPVYYIQYAYARICSILKKAGEENLPAVSKIGFGGLEPTEKNLIKQLIRFPEIILGITQDYQIHHLPQYALDLVRFFHRFYETCRVISEDKEKTQARLTLVLATQTVLKNVLDLMGVSVPEKM